MIKNPSRSSPSPPTPKQGGETTGRRGRRGANAIAKNDDVFHALAADHRLVAAILDAADAAVYVLDGQGRVVFANRAVEALTGYRWRELVGRRPPAALVPAGLDSDTPPQPGLHADAPRQGACCWVRRDGERRCVNWSARLLGATHEGVKYRVVTLTDTTAQTAATEALAAERDFAAAVLWTVPALVAVADPDGRIVRFNKAFADTTGLSVDEVRGTTIWHQIFQPEHASEAERVFAELCARGTPLRSIAELRDREGRQRQIAWHATVMHDAQGKVKHALAGGIDITAERSAVADLRDANERLREVAKAMEGVREEERRRIARELHDELGQALAVLRMDLEAIANDVPPACALSPPAGCENMVGRLRGTLAEVEQVVDAVRRVSAELRPLVLDDLGLGAAVEWLGENFAQRSGLGCEIHVAERCAEVPEPQATALFRILQESLTNIARHARARRVQIDLGCDGGTLMLRIADDGVGILRTEASAPDKTFGLLGMRERAGALGGEMRIDSIPGSGTTITVRMPMPGSGHAEP